MKKIILVVMLLITMLTSVACSSKVEGVAPKLLNTEGIAPYELSESDNYLLQSFGMDKNSQIISFMAPMGAVRISLKICRLDKAGKWESINDSGMCFSDLKIDEQLTGTYTTQLEDDYVIKNKITCAGTMSGKTDAIILEGETHASAHCFLSEFQNIELNKEIPVAIVVSDSGTVMPAFCLDDYFNPSKFEGMDLVQAVTLKFSDKIYSENK